MTNNRYIDVDSGEVYSNADMALQARAERIEQERQEDGNKNPPFIQLTKGVSPDILAKISRENSTAIEVLMFFFKNMDDYNAIMVSQQSIAEAIDSSRRTISRAVKVLEDNGAIGIAKISNANVYLINPNLAWQKAYKQRNVAKLKGVFMFGEDENKELFKRFDEVFKTSEEHSLKLDSISTKFVKPKPVKPEPEELVLNNDSTSPSEAPITSSKDSDSSTHPESLVTNTEPSEDVYEYDEYEQTSMLPEETPPWEVQD